MVGMKMWGAVWGALIGWTVVPDFPPAGLIAGALAGLLAGAWLNNEVKNRATAMVRKAAANLNEEMHAAIARRVDELLAGVRAGLQPPPEPLSAPAQPLRASASVTTDVPPPPERPAARPVPLPVSSEPEAEPRPQAPREPDRKSVV